MSKSSVITVRSRPERAPKKPRAVYPRDKPMSSYGQKRETGLVLSSSASQPSEYRPHPRPSAYSDTRAFKKDYKEASPELQHLVDTVLDPDSVETGSRWPNVYGLSSTYKAVNVLNAAFDANKNSMVIAHPRLTNSILSTAGAVYTQALTPTGTVANNFCYQKVSINEDTLPSCFITTPWYFGGNHVAVPDPANVPAGMTNYLYPIGWASADASAVVNMYFSNIPPGDSSLFSIRFRWYDATFAQTHIVNLALPAAGTVTQTLNPVAATNATAYISIELYAAFQPYEGTVSMQLREVGGGPFLSVNLSNTYTHCIASNLQGAAAIANTSEDYFVVGQSLLCTYTGSSINDGGVISTARLPGDTALGEKTDAGAQAAAGGSSIYGWLASLQNNRYDGRVRQGSYSWYLGDSEEAYFYRPVQEQLDDLPYCVAAFSTTDTASTVMRIKIVTHVIFKSNSSIYSQQPSPYMRDVKLLPHILSLVSSSYSNEGHKGGITETLKSMGKTVGKVLASPKTWMTVAELLAMLA